MTLVIPGFIALFVLLQWLEKLAGKDAVIALAVAAMAILWIKERMEAWKKYRSSPNTHV